MTITIEDPGEDEILDAFIELKADFVTLGIAGVKGNLHRTWEVWKLTKADIGQTLEDMLDIVKKYRESVW